MYNSQKWIALGLILASSAEAAAWEEKFFNPKPLEGDVVLPMPCDGKMVFRVVKTNTNKPLEDIKITLGGNSNSEDNYAQYATPSYIAGSFSDNTKERYFLIGKYEVTEAQYNAVMKAEQCASPNMKGLLPITNVSWFDGVDFSRRYNEWLLKNAADSLPVEDGAKGFVRLPTNAEWEYASRGGAAVDAGVFRENTFPAPNGLNEYAWSSKSANGKLQLIGRLSPNPLGLFDTLGNASEMVFDSFQANKLNRYHGQEGGLVVRGGSYVKPESEVNNVSRIEIPYYDASGATKKKDMGFRLVMTAPLLTSSNKIKQIRQEWEALGNSHQDKEEANIVGKLAELASNVEDDKLKQEINQTKEDLRASNQARDEQRDAAARSALQLGAFLCANVSDLQAVVEREKIAIQSFEESVNAEQDPDLKSILAQKGEDFKLKLIEAEKARDYVLNYYTSTITGTFDTYSQDVVKAQVERVKKIMGEKRLATGEKATNITQYVDLYWSHLNQYYKNGQIGREKWLAQCTDIKSQH